MQLHMQADGMTTKPVVGLLVFIFTLNCLSTISYIDNCKADPVLPKFYVDDDYNSSTPGWQIDHFNIIQDAINESVSGDRIIVYAGIYNETISIPHKLDLFGENRDITIIDGNNTDDVVTISANQVNLSHFTITDRGTNDSYSLITINDGNTIITDNIIESGKYGLIFNNCNNNVIYDNIIRDNDNNGLNLNNSDNNQITYNTIVRNSNGIFLYSSSSNTIQNNPSISDNIINGIFLNETCNLNIVDGNNLSNNDGNGIFLNDHCNYNNLSNNNIYSNTDSGIRSENSSYNTIFNNNIISNNNYGLLVVGSSNTIVYNTINENDEHGIFLFADDNNYVYINEINGNTKDGIHLSNSTNDSIYTNNITYNTGYGIYLDFFTIENLIYNNFLFYNTNNGMDKSLGNNLWNTTKTSETNIVGGSYIFGNYWSNWDEMSEGATDPDLDGISNNTYTIYTTNIDYGPILDITPPNIGTPQVTPSSQTIGSYSYISIDITDNTEIKNVFLNVIDQDSQLTNFTINQNKTGNTYYCNKQFSPVGTYTYYITAKDPRNWGKSANGTFSIIEGTPPLITDNTPTTGHPSESFTFNATVTDDVDSALDLTVKVNWTHGNLSGNNSLIYTEEDFFEKSITLDNSTDYLVYNFYVADQWGNAQTTDATAVEIVDEIPPEIVINTHSYSSDGVINTYIVGATITDNTEIANATVEYWYQGSNHQTAELDRQGSNYFEKIIYTLTNTTVFCILNVSDPSGNQNDTKNPFADTGGPYNGVIGLEITFNGNESFDLDGNITEFSWNFGDGTNDTGEIVEHAYSTNGNYTVTLTVTDEEVKTGIDYTYSIVIKSRKIITSSSTMNSIDQNYDTDLNALFYAYDTDGDEAVDTFVDPNGVLKTVPLNFINLSGSIMFAISIDDEYIPEFFWDANSDEIIEITYIPVRIDNGNIIIDSTSEEAWITIAVNKTDWICVEIDDNYPDATYTITSSSRTINYTWRGENKLLFIDDPDTTYYIYYQNIYLAIQPPTFSPPAGGIIDENRTTILISYTEDVMVTTSSFGSLDVTNDILKLDDQTYSYTPPGYLEYDFYTFEIHASALQGSSQDISTAVYEFVPYSSVPQPPEESLIDKFIWLVYLGGLLGGIFVFIHLIKRKRINFESFVYIKNKKIIPFFKPVVFGPLKIDVDDSKVRKAEFYVNGKLKDTLTQAPFIWNWDEPSFMKHKIETKVYDDQGNSSSSGEMTFYIFNPSKNEKIK